MYYPMFKMTETQLENFIWALHTDHSSKFFCVKHTVLVSTKHKLEKVFKGAPLESLVRSLPRDVCRAVDSNYALRCRWVTRLITYNKASDNLRELHKGFLKMPRSYAARLREKPRGN